MQDIGSGLNYKRKQFIHLFELVEQGRVKTIIIAHRDRLVRFGFEWFEAFCERHGTQIIKLNNEKLSPEREMVEDLIAAVTVFSARFHGLRSYKRTLEKAVQALEPGLQARFTAEAQQTARLAAQSITPDSPQTG